MWGRGDQTLSLPKLHTVHCFFRLELEDGDLEEIDEELERDKVTFLSLTTTESESGSERKNY